MKGGLKPTSSHQQTPLFIITLHVINMGYESLTFCVAFFHYCFIRYTQIEYSIYCIHGRLYLSSEWESAGKMYIHKYIRASVRLLLQENLWHHVVKFFSAVTWAACRGAEMRPRWWAGLARPNLATPRGGWQHGHRQQRQCQWSQSATRTTTGPCTLEPQLGIKSLWLG